MTPPLSLSANPSSLKVKVHPSVLLTICDSYVRRSSKQTRIVGTLLGQIIEGIVEVKNCYAVPHSEAPESVAFDVPHHITMKELHQKVSPREIVVGWFTTIAGEELSAKDNLIQDYYAQECQNPIVLTVDVALKNDKLDVAAYVTRQLNLGSEAVAIEFQPLDCEVRTADLERVEGRLSLTEKVVPDADQLSLGFAHLQSALTKVSSYLDDVVNGKRKGDPAIGRYIADTVMAVPRIEPEALEQLVADDAQDSVLIMYLAKLVRSQLALADRLGTNALPLL